MGKPLFGVTSETWVKWLVTVMAFLVLTVVGWSFRVEGALSQLATKDKLTRALEKHATGGIHKGAATHTAVESMRRRIERLEVGASKTETLLHSMAGTLREIKRELRLMRLRNNGRRR